MSVICCTFFSFAITNNILSEIIAIYRKYYITPVKHFRPVLRQFAAFSAFTQDLRAT